MEAHADPGRPRAPLLGEWQVVRKIGAGGMGAVFEVASTKTRAHAAAKVLLRVDDARARERFRREAELLARCDRHPSIVKVHSCGETEDGALCMILDLVAGESLDRVLERETRLEPRRAAALARDLARALAYVHERGVLHRDVKPSNVLLDGDGAAKLTDFGLATAADVERLTKTGAFVGTLLYCSPEQASRASVGPASDIWSLGAVLFHALAGEPPVTGESALDVFARLASGAPVRSVREANPGVPEPLAAIVACALEKDAARRYPSAAAFADDLERFLGGERPSASSERRAARPRRALLLVALALALGVGLLLVALRASRPPVAAPEAPATAGPEELLRRAAEHFAAGRFADAESDVRAARSAGVPARLEATACELEGDLLARRGEHAAAAKAYGASLAASTARALEARAKLGGEAALAGDDATALACVKELLPDPRRVGDDPRLLGLAPAVWRRALAEKGEPRAKWLVLAARLGDEPEAWRAALATAWLDAAESADARTRALIMESRSYTDSDVEDAMVSLRCYERAARLDPERGLEPLWQHLGLVEAWLLKTGGDTKARILEAACRAAPDEPVLVLRHARGIHAGEPGADHQIRELCRRTMDLLPRHIPTTADAQSAYRSFLHDLVQTFATACDVGDESSQLLERLSGIVARVDSPTLWLALVGPNTNLGHFDRATVCVERALASRELDGTPASPADVESARITLLDRQDRVEEAVALSRRVFAENPNDETRAENLGALYSRRGRRDELFALLPDARRLGAVGLLKTIALSASDVGRKDLVDTVLDELERLHAHEPAADVRRAWEERPR